MTRSLIDITANFRLGSGMQSVEEQYRDLWRLATALEPMGIPLDEWFPPADTEANSLLNKAFDPSGPTAAALAMAKAESASGDEARGLGVWNGTDEDGAIAFTTMVGEGPMFSNLDFTAKTVRPLLDYRNVVKLVQAIVAIWKPVVVQVDPEGYFDRRVFPDRPSVGWMIYLPFEVKANQVPEAAHVIPVKDQRTEGTIIVSVADTFDSSNTEHVQRANAIEVRLVDQDLLPTRMQMLRNF